MITRRMPPTQDGSGYGVVGARSARRARRRPRIVAPIGFVIRSLATGGQTASRMPVPRAYDGTRFPFRRFAVSEPDARSDRCGSRSSAKGAAASSPRPRRMFRTRSRRTWSRTFAAASGRTTSSCSGLTSIAGTGAPARSTMPPGCAIITGAARLDRRRRLASRSAPCASCSTDRRKLSAPAPVRFRSAARSYPKAHEAEIASHVLAGESDFGADRVYSVRLPAGAFNSPFGATLVRVLAPIAVVPSSQPPGERRFGYRAARAARRADFPAQPGRHEVFRHPPHRQRHAGQDRSRSALAERRGLGCRSPGSPPTATSTSARSPTEGVLRRTGVNIR